MLALILGINDSYKEKRKQKIKNKTEKLRKTVTGKFILEHGKMLFFQLDYGTVQTLDETELSLNSFVKGGIIRCI